MDAELQALEREAAGELPWPGLERCRALARAWLRRGDCVRALGWARAEPGGAEHQAAAAALAEQLGLRLLSPSSAGERFATRDGSELALIPAGAFLEDGASAWASILSPGGSRAALARVELPEFLVAILPAGEVHTPDEARAAAAAAAPGGRLPTPREWKKAWRGGLHLAGDQTRRRVNDEPDRIGAWGSRAPPGGSWLSPYGVCFSDGLLEWTEGPEALGAGFLSGRYLFPLGRPEERRGRRLVWRLVLDVPRRAPG